MKRLFAIIAVSLPLLAEAEQPAHISAVQSRLKAINCTAPVTYRTNGDLVDCTVHCRDLAERDAVYTAFRYVKKSALTSTKAPPTVCVVFSRDGGGGKGRLTPPALSLDQRQRQQKEEDSPGAAGLVRGGALAKGREKILSEMLAEYHKAHTYMPEGVYECVEMANDVWNQVQTKGITAKVKVGNIQKDISSLIDADHAWVMAEVAPGKWLALEATAGGIVYRDQNPRYYDGLGKLFSTPKELKDYQILIRTYNTAAAKYNAAVDDYNQMVQQYKSSNWYTQNAMSSQLALKEAIVRARKADAEEVATKLNELLGRE